MGTLVLSPASTEIFLMRRPVKSYTVASPSSTAAMMMLPLALKMRAAAVRAVTIAVPSLLPPIKIEPSPFTLYISTDASLTIHSAVFILHLQAKLCR